MLIELLARLWRRNPARVSALIASTVVAVLATVDVIVPTGDVLDLVMVLAPVLLAGEVTRNHVTPIHSLTTEPHDLPDDHDDTPEVVA